MVDFDLIKKLIKILEEADITGLAVEEGGMKIEIRKDKSGVVVSNIPGQAVSHCSPQLAEAPMAEAAEEAGLIPIVSPMVGTFYRSPSPDSPPYVDVGDDVKAGKVVCIVEAMKLFNEIESEVSGKITKVLVENGQPVEYGQKLFLVKKD